MMYRTRKSFDRLLIRVKSSGEYFFLKMCKHLFRLPRMINNMVEFEKKYLILSIDAERDIYTYRTLIAGWQVGVPTILDILSENDLDKKVCWLIQFDDRDGLAFSNPSCSRYVANHEELVGEIKRKGHEFGLHPTVYAYAGNRWDYRRPLEDSRFVSNLVHRGTQALLSVCKEQPVGCRTGNCHFALSLSKALEIEGYLIDSSATRRFWEPIHAPNAWFAEEKDYRSERASGSKTRVLEIPTTDRITASRRGLFSLEFNPNLLGWHSTSRVLFLSAYFHNWDAITESGKTNPRFKEALQCFISSLSDHEVKVVSFSEAYRIYHSLKKF